MKTLLTTLLLAASLFAAPKVGDSAVSFELPNLYNPNKQTSNEDLKGKVVLLNLWASWCSGCQEEMPLFVELQKQFQGSNFKILLSSIDKDPQSAIAFLQEVDKNKVLQSLYDKQKQLPKAYRCAGMPSSYLIDKNGKIVNIYIGSLDQEAIAKLKMKIKELLGK